MKYIKTNGGKDLDGVRPVKGGQTVKFKAPSPCSAYSQWRFMAAIDCSDNPDDLRVVMIDTGRMDIEKCKYEIETTLGFAFSSPTNNNVA